MDILAQYDKENPQSGQVSKQTYEDISRDSGPIIQLIRKISKGKIQDTKQINILLVVFSIIAILVAVFIFFTSGPRIKLPPPSPYQGVQES